MPTLPMLTTRFSVANFRSLSVWADDGRGTRQAAPVTTPRAKVQKRVRWRMGGSRGLRVPAGNERNLGPWSSGVNAAGVSRRTPARPSRRSA